jgi:hypothetical protein
MKTSLLFAFLVSTIAFAFSPLSIELAVSFLFTIGFGCVVLFEYTREARKFRMRLAPVALGPRRPEVRAFEWAA